MLRENLWIIFTFFTGIAILFQLGLALGMPWGKASWGGKFPGKYPPKMRIIALLNIFLLLIFILIVLIRSHLIFENLLPIAQFSIWLVVVFSGINTILNTLTPSKIEKIWIPVTGIQFITSFFIAIN